MKLYSASVSQVGVYVRTVSPLPCLTSSFPPFPALHCLSQTVTKSSDEIRSRNLALRLSPGALLPFNFGRAIGRSRLLHCLQCRLRDVHDGTRSYRRCYCTSHLVGLVHWSSCCSRWLLARSRRLYDRLCCSLYCSYSLKSFPL